jgi:spoIIIJ-associated protein
MSAPETVQVEASGETVGEARWAALHELERRYPALDRSRVEFVVLSEGERGLLGVGYEPARVLATLTDVPAEGPASTAPTGHEGRGDAAEGDSEAAAAVREMVDRVLTGLELDADLDVEEREGQVVATARGPELGLLIGKHGQTIDAVQYLVNASLHRRGLKGVEAVIDAQGYRKRRERTLTEVAVRAAEEVRRSGQPYALEPMTSAERKIVHTKVQELGGLATASEGLEPNRHVVVLPAADDEV